MKQSTIGRNFSFRRHYLAIPITASEKINNDDYAWLEKASQLQMRRWWKIRDR